MDLMNLFIYFCLFEFFWIILIFVLNLFFYFLSFLIFLIFFLPELDGPREFSPAMCLCWSWTCCLSLCRRGPTWCWLSWTRSSSCRTRPSWLSSRCSIPAWASSPVTWPTLASARRCVSGWAASADSMTSSCDTAAGEERQSSRLSSSEGRRQMKDGFSHVMTSDAGERHVTLSWRIWLADAGRDEKTKGLCSKKIVNSSAIPCSLLFFSHGVKQILKVLCGVFITSLHLILVKFRGSKR